ncbi:hypothetical protein TWF481_010415 [Arthrobotrys musiformis]|uniref:Uncharacterized protein n=1 Tax=Arthrobotrys musiformis TaxID=47236 RepID=A0AAV9W0N7_9PEZI
MPSTPQARVQDGRQTLTQFEVWYPENIDLLEPKKKNDPEEKAKTKSLESPPGLDSDNEALDTNALCRQEKDSDPIRPATSRTRQTYGLGLIGEEFTIDERLSEIQKSPLTCQREIPTKFDQRKLFETAQIPGSPSLGDAQLCLGGSPTQTQVLGVYSHGLGDESGLAFDDGDTERSFCQIPALRGYNCGSGGGAELETPMTRRQMPDHNAVFPNSVMRYHQDQGKLSSPPMPMQMPCHLPQRNFRNDVRSTEVVLSSLRMEPPRFKSEKLHMYKRRRTTP